MQLKPEGGVVTFTNGGKQQWSLTPTQSTLQETGNIAHLE
jgi:hypothetical protein